MDSLRTLLTSRGFDFVPQMDGAYHRFDRGGKTLAGWFRGWELRHPDGTVFYQEASFGDWVTRERHEWKGEQASSNLSPEQLEEIRRLRKEAVEAHAAEKLKRQEEVAVEARRMYESARPADPEHPYLMKKGIRPGPMLRQVGDKLVVPVYFGQGAPHKDKIVSLQFIGPDGEKRFLSGGRLKGCWGWAGAEIGTKGYWLAEGYATAESIAMATGEAVLIAFNASNMVTLAKDLPYAPEWLRIGADNDVGTKGNPGIAAARQALQALPAGVAGSMVAPPSGGESLDLNDFHSLHGLDKLKELLAEGRTRDSSSDETSIPERPTGVPTAPVEAPSSFHPPARGLLPPLESFRPIPIRKDDEGKVIPPAQLQIVNLLLEQLGADLMREGKEVFLWTGTHWEEQDPVNFKFYVKRAAMRILHGKAKEKELNDLHSLFIGYLDAVPPGQSFYRQDPRLANFLDGTLEVVRARRTRAAHAGAMGAGSGEVGGAAARADEAPGQGPRGQGAGQAGGADPGADDGAGVRDDSAGVGAKTPGGEGGFPAPDDSHPRPGDGGAGAAGDARGVHVDGLHGQVQRDGQDGPRQGGVYELRFRPHARGDLLTWVLPYRHADRRAGGAKGKFHEWLGRCFESDADAAGKVRALAQVGGACLVSLFPRYVFLHGPGGTGKSTFAKLCMRFLSPKNVCSVEPREQGTSFGKELMINKQANIVTDISGARVDSALFKRSEDRVPEYVNRKGRAAVMGFTPALDIYCCNELPRGIDGESSAMDRRVTIVEFSRKVAREGEWVRDFDLDLLADAPGVVLDFFLGGLEDLCNSGGIYFNPHSGRQLLQEWKDSESLSAQLLEAISGGDFPLLELHPEGMIARAKLTAMVCPWFGGRLTNAQMGRIYSDLEARGFARKKVHGVRMISGIRVKGAEV